MSNTTPASPRAKAAPKPAAKTAAKPATKPATKSPAKSPAAASTSATKAAPEAPRISPYAGFTPLSPSDEKLWSALIQLGGIFIYFAAPLIGYLLRRQRGPFVREHSVAALNWQLSLLLYSFASSILLFVVVGTVLLSALAVLNIVFSILATMHAHRGQLYVYPLSIKFIRA